jgi:hypothetical protein
MATAQTLTGLIPTIYQARNVVSRERLGFIGAVQRNSSAEMAALDETIRVPIAPAVTTAGDNTPALEIPDTGASTISYVDMTISRSKHVPVPISGEEAKGLRNAGTFEDVMKQRFQEAFRYLDNYIEADLASTYKFASRAVGTAGTTPFNTAGTVSDFANVMQILDDNGCPPDGMNLVLNNAAWANLRGKQSNFFKVNEAGSDEMLRDGAMAKAFGFKLFQSAQVARHTIGTLAGSPTLTSADHAVGATNLATAAAGTGTIVEGDMLNAAGENNGIWYGVRTGVADLSQASTALTLNAPGLRIAQTTNTSALTLAAAYRANLAFHPSAIQLITRPPAMGDDKAISRELIYDDVSGITYEVAEYPGFGVNVFHVRLAWGWKAIKQEHIAVLFG